MITTEAPFKLSLSGSNIGKNRRYYADGDQCVTKIVHTIGNPYVKDVQSPCPACLDQNVLIRCNP